MMNNKKLISISDYIDTDLREYAVYSLSKRGIPSFYDCLTPVQRLILNNAPLKSGPSNSLIGKCITAGYKHGDASLASAISKLCRETSNANTLLQGSGFHGNRVSRPSAARYTKCSVSPWCKEEMSQYSDINEYDDEGFLKYMNLAVPMGLCTNISGVGTAYNSKILPRKYGEIKRYVEGDNNADLNPYFSDFSGTVQSGGGLTRWIFSSRYESSKAGFRVIDLPPYLKYETFLARLSEVVSDYPRLKFDNNTKDKLNILIKLSKRPTKERKEIISRIMKITTTTVVENILMTNDKGIIEYDSIYSYLEDYKIHLSDIKSRWLNHQLKILIGDKNYHEILLSFLVYMQAEKRNRQEVLSWLKINGDSNADKLKQFPAYKINNQEIEAVIKSINSLKRKISSKTKEISKFDKSINKSLIFGMYGKSTMTH